MEPKPETDHWLLLWPKSIFLLLVLATSVLTVFVFICDWLIPVEAGVALLYVGAVLLSLGFPLRWQTYLVAAVCSALTIVRWLVADPANEVWWTGLSRAIAVLALWLIAVLGTAIRSGAEQSLAHLKLREEVRAREIAEKRLHEQTSLLNLAHDAITVRDLDDRIVFWNKGAEKMYGWTTEEALGRNAGELIFAEGDATFAEARRKMREDGQWFGVFHQITKDGRTLIAETRWTLVRDEEGVPSAVLVVNTDITEKKQLETQVLRTQRLESIGILAEGIAHDFNNLLTPILMAVKLLREPRPEHDRQKLLATLQASAERGAETVKQLLAFAGGSDGERRARCANRRQRSPVDSRTHLFQKHSHSDDVFRRAARRFLRTQRSCPRC